MTDATTPRGYPKPHPDNVAADDAVRIATAFDRIDADISKLAAADPADLAGVAPVLDLILTDRAGLPAGAFSRASAATHFDLSGVMRLAAAGVPRIDHDPATGACLGLLVEEARTNVCWPSSDFTHANWAKQYVTLAAGAMGPDGTAMARVVETADASIHRLLYGFSSTAQAWTASGFSKAAERRYLMVRMWDGTTELGARFDFQSGTAPLCDNGVVARIRPAGNGIWRWSITRTLAGAGSSLSIYMLTEAGAASYAGSTASAVQVWGVQIEQGAYPSSYIPTLTGQVTRAADLPSISLADVPGWRADAGTVYVEHLVFGSTGSQELVLATNAAGTEHFRLRLEPGALYASSQAAGGSSQTSLGVPILGVKGRAVFAWSSNAWAAQMRGGALKSGPLILPSGLDRLCLGNFLGGNLLNGSLSRVIFWPRRLSDAVITSLATP